MEALGDSVSGEMKLLKLLFNKWDDEKIRWWMNCMITFMSHNTDPEWNLVMHPAFFPFIFYNRLYIFYGLLTYHSIIKKVFLIRKLPMYPLRLYLRLVRFRQVLLGWVVEWGDLRYLGAPWHHPKTSIWNYWMPVR